MINSWIPEHPAYLQDNTAAVIFDPEGGHHVCYEHSNGLFWCAGMLANSPAELADRIHAHWWDESPDGESEYARQERSFGEQP